MLDEYKDILTIKDACAILGISRNTLYSLLNEGKIQAVRCGRNWRISKQALIDYVNCGKKY